MSLVSSIAAYRPSLQINKVTDAQTRAAQHTFVRTILRQAYERWH